MIADIKAMLRQQIQEKYPSLHLYEESMPEPVRLPACQIQLTKQEMRRRIGGSYAVTAYFTLRYMPELAAEMDLCMQMQTELLRLLAAVDTYRITGISSTMEQKNSIITFQVGYFERAEEDSIRMNQMQVNSFTE